MWRNLSRITSAFTGDMLVAVEAFSTRFSSNVLTWAGQNMLKKSPFDSGDRP
jgi:hypothetical protein